MSGNAQSFDEAATLAADHLEELMTDLTPKERVGAKTIADWFASNYIKAGHKRLGRILVRKSKDLAEGGTN